MEYVCMSWQDVEIKKMGGSATYGFILYYDLLSAVTARRYMDGHNMKGNTLRVSEQEREKKGHVLFIL